MLAIKAHPGSEAEPALSSLGVESHCVLVNGVVGKTLTFDVGMAVQACNTQILVTLENVHTNSLRSGAGPLFNFDSPNRRIRDP